LILILQIFFDSIINSLFFLLLNRQLKSQRVVALRDAVVPSVVPVVLVASQRTHLSEQAMVAAPLPTQPLALTARLQQHTNKKPTTA
jgi:hypothetical protein